MLKLRNDQNELYKLKFLDNDFCMGFTHKGI